MATRGQDIASLIKREIGQFSTSVTMVDIGTVVGVGDGIARIQGLAAARYNELLQFPNEIMGIAMNLEESSVAAIILGDYSEIKEGDEVQSTGRIAEVPVGDALIGRVVDPLGRPLDGKGAIKTDKTRPLERVAPNVALRQSVNTPVHTGVKAIDSLIPIGRGQRELLAQLLRQCGVLVRAQRLDHGGLRAVELDSLPRYPVGVLVRQRSRVWEPARLEPPPDRPADAGQVQVLVAVAVDLDDDPPVRLHHESPP